MEKKLEQRLEGFMKDEMLSEFEEKLNKTLSAFKKDLSKVRTGLASPSLFEDLKVTYYNQLMPINQVASINTLDQRTVSIQPWDQSLIPEIEKAIHKSELGVTPISDGKVIKVVFPKLTEERRRELLKLIGKMLENTKVAMRNLRRETIEKLKKMEKEKQISKDDLFRKETEVQKILDKYIELSDKAFSEKEKEILTL